MSITFRPIVPEDRDFLYRVYASTREEELALVQWSAEEKEAFLRMQFNAQHAHYQEHFSKAQFQIILLDGKQIGRLYVDRTTHEIHIIDIALLPEHRRAGIGSSLLRGILQEARESAKPVLIYVEKANPALGLYQRLGFVQTGDAGVYWIMKWVPQG